jgi:hypothetical protein
MDSCSLYIIASYSQTIQQFFKRYNVSPLRAFRDQILAIDERNENILIYNLNIAI